MMDGRGDSVAVLLTVDVRLGYELKEERQTERLPKHTQIHTQSLLCVYLSSLQTLFRAEREERIGWIHTANEH